MKTTERSAVVVFGCDLVDEGEQLGPETIARCHQAKVQYDFLSVLGQRPVIIMSPGMSKPGSYPMQRVPMAQMMRDWFRENGVHEKDMQWRFNRPSRNIWGTRPEMHAALTSILLTHSLPASPITLVHVVSSAYHLLRIRIITERYMKYSGMKDLVQFVYVGSNYRSPHKWFEYRRNLPGEFVIGGLLGRRLYGNL